MFGIKKSIKKVVMKRKWRKKNKHNYTIANSLFNPDQVIVGNKTYGELNINLGTNPKRTVSIGAFCSIAPSVNFIINPHNYRFFSTWGWQIYEYHERNYEWEKKTSIVVEDDVWIGYGATILGGSVLHQGCVVGANSVVSGEVPAYSIYAGGKIIKYRFSQEICDKLNQIDYSKIDGTVIDMIKGWHKEEITEKNIDKLLKIVPLKNS
ncbi:MAG: antibiotic acetyltransferase [Butyrivibrio sp.]|jgi:acetyltransferase-like isoleucine patch superfamily enzyme|nr:antibiotic acetyltransferase [Butyrivibrio sp.]